jgi:hypothetical protein
VNFQPGETVKTDIQKLQDMLTKAGVPFSFGQNDDGTDIIQVVLGDDEEADPEGKQNDFLDFEFDHDGVLVDLSLDCAADGEEVEGDEEVEAEEEEAAEENPCVGCPDRESCPDAQ